MNFLKCRKLARNLANEIIKSLNIENSNWCLSSDGFTKGEFELVIEQGYIFKKVEVYCKHHKLLIPFRLKRKIFKSVKYLTLKRAINKFVSVPQPVDNCEKQWQYAPTESNVAAKDINLSAVKDWLSKSPFK